MIKAKGILDLEKNFDIFLFDAYGVFWSGSSFYKGVLDTMKKLINNGRIIYIVSNGTKTSKSSIDGYAKYGLIKGIHYNDLITSGDVLKSYLLMKKLHFKKNNNPKNVYILGECGKNIFDGTDYKVVDDIKDADFIYTAVPKLNENEFNNYSRKDELFESNYSKEKFWNSISINPFINKLNLAVNSNLPTLNANPDFKASVGTTIPNKDIFAIRNGSFAEYIRNHNGEVVEFGKPDLAIYNFVFDKMKKAGIKIPDKSRICMIGDSLRTDIKGANNFGIKSILCIKTGMTAYEIQSGTNLEDLIKSENVTVDYIIDSVSGIY